MLLLTLTPLSLIVIVAAIKALGEILPLRPPPGTVGDGALDTVVSLSSGLAAAPVTPLNHLKR